jgi:hypothetical protein
MTLKYGNKEFWLLSEHRRGVKRDYVFNFSTNNYPTKQMKHSSLL